MLGKLTRLMISLSLLAVIAPAPSHAVNACFDDCYNYRVQLECSDIPSGPAQFQCWRGVTEVCRCSCFGYCP